MQKKIEYFIGEHEGKFGIQKGGREQLLHAIPVAFRECDNFLLHVPVSRKQRRFLFLFSIISQSRSLVGASRFRLHNYSEVSTITFRFIQRKSNPIF